MQRRRAFTGNRHTPMPTVGESTVGPAESGEARRARGISRWGALGAAVLGILALLLLADVVTSSPALCGSCHEMKPRADAWAKSAHTEVKCVTCHEKPYPWYAVPQRVAARYGLLARDIGAHLSGKYDDPVDARIAGGSAMTDEHCLQCHSANRKATSGFRIKIDHVKHAERNGSCVSCHVRVGHPIASRGNALSLMGQCFTCHGIEKTAKAPAACTLCHPGTYELRPASHKARAWRRGHGSTASVDPKQCTMCHKKSFCLDCHGVEMPHPKGWAVRGRPSANSLTGEAPPSGHAASAQVNRAVCARCHENKPDLCSMCHHKAWEPAKGTWVQQHFDEVHKKGPAYCMKCHAAVFCVRCHVQYASS